jgi:hypothetical protein
MLLDSSATSRGYFVVYLNNAQDSLAAIFGEVFHHNNIIFVVLIFLIGLLNS